MAFLNLTPDVAPPLSQQDFDLYCGRWKVLVNSDDPKQLLDCFAQMNYVGFRGEKVNWLISTVGAYSIEARFVCLPSAPPTEQSNKFGVVFYAADRNGNRLSAYYTASPENFPTPDEGDSSESGSGGVQGAVPVASYLGNFWIQTWLDAHKAGKITRDMFATAAGTLEGYSFSLGDLTQALFPMQPESNVSYNLLFSFCLHEYYALAKPQDLTRTFGLVARLYKHKDGTGPSGLLAGAVGGAGNNGDEPDGTYYDMSVPRPPFGGH